MSKNINHASFVLSSEDNYLEKFYSIEDNPKKYKNRCLRYFINERVFIERKGGVTHKNANIAKMLQWSVTFGTKMSQFAQFHLSRIFR